MLTTSEGLVEFNLLIADAPLTAGNFVELARKGFYDGSRFLRTVPGHSLLGGAPKLKSSGGPGYCFDGDSSKVVKHAVAGVVSMVSLGPGTLGSQFQITLGPAPDLDDKAAVFATVSKGLDVVQRLAAKPDTSTIDKVEIRGDFSPSPVERVAELDTDDLARFLGPSAKTLAANIGRSLELGKLTALNLESSRSRCALSQARFRADFTKASDSHLLIYAQSGEGSATIRQFQFERGTPP